MSSSSLFFYSSFPLDEDDMDILNHFIYFMTCEMRWETSLLGVTIELIFHIPKRVFHWNIALIYIKKYGTIYG
jgi:hypothetical protein